MFFCAVARPYFDRNRNRYFDGKLGLWPYVEEVVARRTSANRIAGTKELKPILKVDREATRKMMIENLLPAIKEKMPRQFGEDGVTWIQIQQDNVRPHVSEDDASFLLACSQLEGLKVTVTPQPANSPDLNVLDLGFFSSIQSLQQTKQAHDIHTMLKAVKDAFDEYPTEKIEDVF